jgi:8-oxo-dGTP pyrophosphatase MutT (NUDIX family)
VWALPKGIVDAGESPAETALREGFEETGVHGRVDSKLGDVRYVYTWEGERVFKVVSFFLTHAVSGRIGVLPLGMDVEVAEARWLPLEDASALLAYGGEREMVAKATERLATELL